MQHHFNIKKMSPKDKRLKMIDFARKLFCKIDSNGERVFSFDDIATKIQQKYNKGYDRSTIKRWSQKYDFESTFENIKKEAVNKAIKEENDTIEKIVERQSDILAKDFKNAENLANVGYKLFFDYYSNKEHQYIDEKIALQAIKMGTDIKHRIMQLPTDEKTTININVDPFSKIRSNSSLDDTNH